MALLVTNARLADGSHVDVTVISDLELGELPTVTMEVEGVQAAIEVAMRSIDGESTVMPGFVDDVVAELLGDLHAAHVGRNDGDVFQVGNLEMQVLHTPGHTPGSCCFLVDGNLFTGDTLFVGDAGRTDLKGGSLDRLIQSIDKKLMGLADGTRIWPGHDYGDSITSTIGREKNENPYTVLTIDDDDGIRQSIQIFFAHPEQ